MKNSSEQQTFLYLDAILIVSSATCLSTVFNLLDLNCVIPTGTIATESKAEPKEVKSFRVLSNSSPSLYPGHKTI